jgi:hypothetical protein
VSGGLIAALHVGSVRMLTVGGLLILWRIFHRESCLRVLELMQNTFSEGGVRVGGMLHEKLRWQQSR